jgi:hypothetical protein
MVHGRRSDRPATKATVGMVSKEALLLVELEFVFGAYSDTC